MFTRALLTSCAVLVLVSCSDDGAPPVPQPDILAWGDFGAWGDFETYPPPQCGPGSCSGCCMQGVCLEGDIASACGVGGASCQACAPDETCDSGACQSAPCTPTTCPTGCCDASGQCLSGQSDSACGTGGESCGECASTEVCSAGTCVPQGPKKYKVILVSAKVTGPSWMVCGFAEMSECDLYVHLKVGQATATSQVIKNDNSPVWNEFMLAAEGAKITQSFEVDVRDEDPVGSVSIGACKPQITQANLQAGKHVSDCVLAKELTWKFELMQ